MPNPVGPPPKKKKKKIQPKINAFQADGAKLNEVLNTKYKGKRILLDAKYLYGRHIPTGEEELLFQYQIALVNNDNETAEIEYQDKCVTDGDHVFTNYPDTSGVEGTIENYDLATFKDDHERYLVHIGRGNKITNDAKEVEAKAIVEEKISSSVDVSDLQAKLEGDDAVPFQILMDEFTPEGPFLNHEMKKGPHKGTIVKKQKWSKCTRCFIWNNIYSELNLCPHSLS